MKRRGTAISKRLRKSGIPHTLSEKRGDYVQSGEEISTRQSRERRLFRPLGALWHVGGKKKRKVLVMVDCEKGGGTLV